jgi:uncharacterized NAD(P)/FAD-binding protein YdhS
MASSPVTIAIVGGGACGLSVLLCLLEMLKVKKSNIRQIYVFERRSEIGPGLAYSDGCGSTIMNMEAITMGLHVSDPLHFSRWVSQNFPEYESVRYPPRHLYQKYLVSLSESAALEATLANVKLDVKHSEVQSISKLENSLSLTDENGEQTVVDRAVLAIGNFTAQKLHHLADKSGYFDSPWPLERLDKISKHSSVCIVGSRLTAIDAAIHLVENGHAGPIYLVSRSGRLPKVQGPAMTYPDRHVLFRLAKELDSMPEDGDQFQTLFESLKMLMERSGVQDWHDFTAKNSPMEALESSIQRAESGTEHWRAIARFCGPLWERYWASLQPKRQEEFLKTWESLWYYYIHAMPIDNAKKLLKLFRENRIELLDFQEGRWIDGHFQVATSGRMVQTDFLIEATGIEMDIEEISSPLVKSLIACHMLEPCGKKGFVVDQYTLESTTTRGVYLIGALTTGVHFFTNSIIRNVVHASRVASALVGDPVLPPIHMALILPAYSHYWVRFVVDAVPTLLQHDLIPFIYIGADSERQGRPQDKDEPAPEELLQDKNDWQSSINSKEQIRYLREQGLSLRQCEVSSPSFIPILQDDYVDTGIIFGDIYSSTLEPGSIFTPRKRLSKPHGHLFCSWELTKDKRFSEFERKVESVTQDLARRFEVLKM